MDAYVDCVARSQSKGGQERQGATGRLIEAISEFAVWLLIGGVLTFFSTYVWGFLT